MTSPYVTFAQPQPQPESTQRPSAWPVLRAILSVFLVLAGLVGFLVAGFAALITWTGCFIECSGGNHPEGGALGLLAVALLAAGPSLVALIYRSKAWLWVAAFAAAAGTVLLALFVANN
jgi:hypothetical protein